jgi:outer membrane lipoprotein SlyB
MRLAGIVFAALLALLVAGCGRSGQTGASVATRSTPSPAPTARATGPTPVPTPRIGPPASIQNLTFSGDVNGTMTALVTQSPQTASACSERPVEAAAWASTLYGTIGGTVYGFVATVKPYNGPGTYTAAQAQVQLFSVSDQQKTWESLPGDAVSFTVHNDNLTGTVNATLTDLGSDQATLNVSGNWSCAP